MCLAPEVDVVAGIGMTVVAVDAIRHVRQGRTAPIALLPAIFAVHTFTSAFVWWGSQGKVPAAVGDFAANFFIFIAFVLLPIYVPISILLLEPRGWRRDGMLVLCGAGILSGIDFLGGIVGGQATATACDYYIDYEVAGRATFSGILYVAATCGAMLLSGYRPLFLWGIFNAVAVGILLVMNRNGLPSLWCFWAACTSVFVSWLMRQIERDEQAGRPPPWQDSTPAPQPQPV